MLITPFSLKPERKEMGKDLKGKELGKGITQRKDGRYFARYTDKYGRRKSLYSDSIRDIKRMLRDAVYEEEYGLRGNGINVTLDEWFTQWLELYKSKTVKITTQCKFQTYYYSRVSDSIGGMYLKDIKTIHLQKLINDLLEDGLSVSTIRNLKAIIGDMLNRAVQNEYILKNPCDGVEIQAMQRIESRVLTAEEQQKFFEYATNYAHINILKLTLLTGMRIGEILGLQWSDIDFENRKINIDKTLHYGKDKLDGKKCVYFYTTVKTSSSNRVIPMSEGAYRVLQDEKNKQQISKINFNNKWNPSKEFENLVFLGRAGTPVNNSMINTAINSYIKKINIYERRLSKAEGRNYVEFQHFSCHSLRHTFATRCYEQGVQDKVIQKLLGHSSIGTTMNVYTHVTQELQKNAMSTVEIQLPDICY